MAAFDLTLTLFGAFVFALEKDIEAKKISNVWALGADARSACMASDKQSYLPSHWPALLLDRRTFEPFLPEQMISLDNHRVLWLFDGHELCFADAKGKNTPLSGHFEDRPPWPPTADNEDYFSWVADLPSAAPGAQLRCDLFGPDPAGISCRVALDHGYFTSAELGQDQHNYLKYSLEQLHVTSHHKPYGALANGVSVLLGSFNSLKLVRVPIAGAADGTRKRTQIKISGKKKVEIRLLNTPPEHILPMPMYEKRMLPMSAATDPYVAHFELLYGLLQKPPAQLLVPYAKLGAGTTNHNVSCPPGAVVI